MYQSLPKTASTTELETVDTAPNAVVPTTPVTVCDDSASTVAVPKAPVALTPVTTANITGLPQVPRPHGPEPQPVQVSTYVTYPSPVVPPTPLTCS